MRDIFIGSYSLFELCAYFYIYSFLGWCAEVVFAAAKTGKFVNRGFLNGPVCPIYGTGVVLLLLCLTPLRDWFWAVFLCSALLCSALEFLTGLVLERIFRRKWWDYSDRPFNLKGYVCLSMSLLWGVACLAVMYAVQPAAQALVSLFSPTAGYVLLGIAAAITAADLVFTLLQISSLGKKYRALGTINRALRVGSDAIGSTLASAALRGEKALEKAKEKGAALKDSGREKMENYRYKNALHKRALYDKIEKSRLAKAFPSLLPSDEKKRKLNAAIDAHEALQNEREKNENKADGGSCEKPKDGGSKR